jgi:hypothetical protein
MTQHLERRYRRLLVTYPAEYRQDHESEILGTLLEAAAPGQQRPSPREAAALLLGGLRTRARLAARSPRLMWSDGVRLGVLLILSGYASGGIRFGALLVTWQLSSGAIGSRLSVGAWGVPYWWSGGPPVTAAPWAVVGIASCLALVAVVRDRHRIALAAVTGAVVVALVVAATRPFTPVPLGLVLAGGVVGVLAFRRSPKPDRRPWPWWLASLVLVWVGVDAALGDSGTAFVPVTPILLELAPVAILLVISLATIDPRPAVAVALSAAGGVCTNALTFTVLAPQTLANQDVQIVALLGLVMVGTPLVLGLAALWVTVRSVRRLART